MIAWLAPGDPPDHFPPVERALLDPPGLLAAGGDLSCERLVAAYRRGIFPWYSPGQPVLWWSPDPREVLLPEEFHSSRSLRRSTRTRGFEYCVDRDFVAVIAACAALFAIRDNVARWAARGTHPPALIAAAVTSPPGAAVRCVSCRTLPDRASA